MKGSRKRKLSLIFIFVESGFNTETGGVAKTWWIDPAIKICQRGHKTFRACPLVGKGNQTFINCYFPQLQSHPRFLLSRQKIGDIQSTCLIPFQ